MLNVTPLRLGVLCYCLDSDVVVFAEELQRSGLFHVTLYPLSNTGNGEENAKTISIHRAHSTVRPVPIFAMRKGSTKEPIAMKLRILTCYNCVTRAEGVLLFGLLGPSALIASVFAKLYRRRLIAVVVSMAPRLELQRSYFIQQAKRLLFIFIDTFLYRTSITHENLVVRYGINPNKLLRLGVYSSLRLFTQFINGPIMSHVGTRTSYGIGRDTVVYLSVGTLLPHKGFDTLIRAFAGIQAQVPDSHLLIVGGDGAPPLGCMRELEELVERFALHSSVTITGPRSLREVVALYHCSDVFVLATLRDMAPKVLFEAALCGLPLITTPEAAVEGDLLKHNVNGLLVESRREDLLGQAMVKLADRSLRKSMSWQSTEIVRGMLQDLDEAKTVADAMSDSQRPVH